MNNQIVIKADGSIEHHPQGELFAVREVEVDGIQMGVLNDGTPYLTARGLANMCGIDHSVLVRMANNWREESEKPRGRKISQVLAAQGHAGSSLYLRTIRNGTETHAYTDAVSMAILEYYAFDAEQGNNTVALRNYRILARASFRKFIYDACGYDPNPSISESWKNFQERVLLNDQVPHAYFSVFREIADVVIHIIRSGCSVDDHTVPDISVGLTWGKHWTAISGDTKYGDRQKHPHVYPEWFPQAAVNPVEAWVYPLSALGDFRLWLYETYVTTKFPKYVQGKVAEGRFLPSSAKILIEAMKRPELPSGL
ncbi:hypothetical protein ACQKIE_16210 [Luteibacter sp. NPDC031894]|uniref:hypothetical protein n=1 Tax=Luteibacter sp. NPDC031894 TaxID=3390572 RepID=UPI003D01DAB1